MRRTRSSPTGLHRAQSAEAIVERVTDAVDERLAARDLADVRALLEHTGAHTTGVVGPVAALDAAEHGAADLVLMTPRYRQSTLPKRRVSSPPRAHRAVESIRSRTAPQSCSTRMRAASGRCFGIRCTDYQSRWDRLETDRLLRGVPAVDHQFGAGDEGRFDMRSCDDRRDDL